MAGAALYEGSWNTNQIGTLPDGDTLSNGEFYNTWGADGLITSFESSWNSIGDSGTQWSIQGTGVSNTPVASWTEGVYSYISYEAVFQASGQFMFDGELYTGNGWTQNLSVTYRYIYINSKPYYAGIFGEGSFTAHGLIDDYPFEIQLAATFEESDFNSVEGWSEGQSNYFEAAISSVPVPAAIWLFGSGLIGFVGIRRRFLK